MSDELQRGEGRRTGRGSDEDPRRVGSKREVVFLAKHVVGGDNSLADLITRCEHSRINEELK